jgi:hypothetical protein
MKRYAESLKSNISFDLLGLIDRFKQPHVLGAAKASASTGIDRILWRATA